MGWAPVPFLTFLENVDWGDYSGKSAAPITGAACFWHYGERTGGMNGYGTDTYTLVVGDTLDDDYYQTLKSHLRGFNRRAAPGMMPPEARALNIRVHDGEGRLVGGLAALTYWGWLVIRLLVIDDDRRGNGLGHQLIERAHDEALARGCSRAQTQTYDFQALEFYLRHGYQVVGEMKDYPEGHDYYWLRRDL